MDGSSQASSPKSSELCELGKFPWHLQPLGYTEMVNNLIKFLTNLSKDVSSDMLLLKAMLNDPTMQAWKMYLCTTHQWLPMDHPPVVTYAPPTRLLSNGSLMYHPPDCSNGCLMHHPPGCSNGYLCMLRCVLNSSLTYWQL